MIRMPDKERLRQLAVLVDGGEATPDERAELEAGFAADPALAAEIRELSNVDRVLREAAFQPAPMPPAIRERLERVRRDALSARIAAEAQATGQGNVTALQSDANAASARRNASRRKLGARFPRILAAAACVAGLLVVVSVMFFWWTPTRSPIAVLAPVGETMHTQPTLVWDAQPGKLYNVWVISPVGPPADAPVLFKAVDKQSPLPFDQLTPTPNAAGKELTPDQDYRVLICPAGASKAAGTAVLFHTAAGAAGPPIPGSLEKARAVAATGRVGDALMLLATAPDRNSPEGQALETELRAKLPNQVSK